MFTLLVDNYILLFFILLLVVFLVFSSLKKNKHRLYIKSGNRVIKKLSSIEHDGAKLNYLRKINPYVFEELVLTAFEKKGYRIKRNKKYSGDGGIDGKIFNDNKLFLIQSKRYSNAINPKHVIDFCKAIKRENAFGGYFVHTGRTGLKSHLNSQETGNIEFVSGSKLLSLISIS